MKFKYVLDRNVNVDERSPEWCSYTCNCSFIERSTFMSQNIDFFHVVTPGTRLISQEWNIGYSNASYHSPNDVPGQRLGVCDWSNFKK